MEEETNSVVSKEIVWKQRKRNWCGTPFTFTIYSLSRDRLFIKAGFLNQTENEVRLYRIRDVSLKRTLMQRLFGLGTIYVCSTDSNMKDFKIINVPDSKNFKEMLSEFVEAERQRKRVSAREYMSGHDEDFDSDDENETENN